MRLHSGGLLPMLVFVLSISAASTFAQALTEPPASSPFITPAINNGIFREGEVRRVTKDYNSWKLACDEIVRLQQRYCSLFSLVSDQMGQPVGRIIMSTSDDGHPAALLHIPLGIVLPRGVEVTAEPQPGQDATSQRERRGSDPTTSHETERLNIVTCAAKSCLTLWQLNREQIEALNTGGELRLRFSQVRSLNMGQVSLTEDAIQTEAVIDGVGFRDAINASVKQHMN